MMGAEDEACVARATDLAVTLPGSSTATIEAAAHFLPLEQPAALAREILRIAESA